MAVPASECLIITPLWYTAVVRVGDLIMCTWLLQSMKLQWVVLITSWKKERG